MQSIDQKGPNERENHRSGYIANLPIFQTLLGQACTMPSARFRMIDLRCITRQRHRRDNSSQERSMCSMYSDAASMPCHTINYSKNWFTEKLVSFQEDVLAASLSIDESIISPLHRLPTLL